MATYTNSLRSHSPEHKTSAVNKMSGTISKHPFFDGSTNAKVRSKKAAKQHANRKRRQLMKGLNKLDF